MHKEVFFQDPDLLFAEVRYSKDSRRDFKPHIHTAFCIGGIEQGRVRCWTAQETVILSSGSLILLNPETLHSCNTLDGEERSYYMLYLDPEWCFQVQRSLWQIDGFMPVEKMQVDDERLYQQYCMVMIQVMESRVMRSEKEQLLFDLAVEIFSKNCGPQVEEKISSEAVEQLKTCLAEDLHRDLTLHSLSEQLGVNPYTLLRRFKTLTGVTPHAYRMNCRIEQARRHLRQGMDIADTALACGFFDQSHFHRHFKAVTSVTPREYRVNFIQ